MMRKTDSTKFGKISRRKVLATTGVAGATGLAGCSSISSDDSDGGTVNQQNEDISIRYIPHGAPGQDPFWEAQDTGWSNAISQLGVDGAYQAPGSSSDFTQQVSNVETAIDSGVDAIALTLPDPPLFQEALQRAGENGIYTIVTNVTEQSYLSEGTQSMPYSGYVGQNEAAVGEALASNTLPLFTEKTGSTPERAVILNHDPGLSSLELRQGGIETVLDNENIPYDSIEVPAGDPSGVISRLASYRSSNPNVGLTFTLGPTAGNPAIDYITNEGLENELYHAGVDISEKQATGLREGYNLSQVIQQPALQAYLAAHYLVTHLRSGILAPRHTPTGPTFITADNVDAVQRQIDTFGVA
jgi:simple sugar transport system substrate-binding protein